jgi:hypothetical protein
MNVTENAACLVVQHYCNNQDKTDRVDHLHAGAFIQSSCVLSDLQDFCSASG